MPLLQRLALFYIDVPALRPGTLGAYAFAFFCAGVATALRVASDPYVAGGTFITFFPAVVVTTLISGFGAGIFCVVLSTAAASFFLLAPRLAFYIENPADVMDLLLSVVGAIFYVILIAGMRLAIERDRELRRKLEQRVEEGGTELASVHRRLEHEAIFRAMFNMSSVGKVEVDPETGRFLRANEAMCKFVGYSEPELLARTVFDITHPDHLDRDRELFRQVVAGESAFDVEKRYIRKDGKAVWARTTVNVIRDKFGRPFRNTAVVQDINAHKQAEQALQAGKDNLQLALNAALLGWWQYDPGQRLISWDTRSKEIVDIAEDRTPLEEVMKLVHPDDAERVWTGFQAARDPIDSTPYAIDFRVPWRDGKVRWVEVHWLAYFEGAKHERAMSIVGTLQDITERKEHEEKERLLIREINHRAKNMLSVVDAIAHQTAAKNPEDFVERFSERIQALSANQDLLVKNEWRGVDLEELVRAQLAHFADLIGARIAVRGPKLRLKAAAGQAIGLALHELATNAGKYGALSFTMNWKECKGPPVSAPERRGFGTIVITMMAERSVDGAVDLDYSLPGLTWRLTCPTASALESG